MSALAVMLVAMGIADVCRGFRAPWVSLAVGPVVVVAVAALSALWHVGDIALLIVAAAATVVWRMLSRGAERIGRYVIAPLVVFFVADRDAYCVVRLGISGKRRSLPGGCRGPPCRSGRCHPRSC